MTDTDMHTPAPDAETTPAKPKAKTRQTYSLMIFWRDRSNPSLYDMPTRKAAEETYARIKTLILEGAGFAEFQFKRGEAIIDVGAIAALQRKTISTPVWPDEADF